PQGGLERVTSRRLRRLVALSAAILSFGLLPGTANAWTLSSTQSFPFAGTFEPIIVPNLIGPAFGCSSGTETNCKFFMFQVSESGTATLNLSADLGSSVDASVDCNGEVDEFGFPVTRAITSTDPFTGQAPPMAFA